MYLYWEWIFFRDYNLRKYGFFNIYFKVLDINIIM